MWSTNWKMSKLTKKIVAAMVMVAAPFVWYMNKGLGEVVMVFYAVVVSILVVLYFVSIYIYRNQ